MCRRASSFLTEVRSPNTAQRSLQAAPRRVRSFLACRRRKQFTNCSAGAAPASCFSLCLPRPNSARAESPAPAKRCALSYFIIERRQAGRPVKMRKHNRPGCCCSQWCCRPATHAALCCHGRVCCLDLRRRVDGAVLVCGGVVGAGRAGRGRRHHEAVDYEQPSHAKHEDHVHDREAEPGAVECHDRK